jgi:hypothetical protein
MKQSQRAVLVISLLAMFLSSTSAFVLAQYQTEETTTVTIPDTGAAVGVFTADQTSTVGVSIDIAGVPGSSGSVSTAVTVDNPQPNAIIPANTTLSPHFIIVSFNMSSSDFLGANITIHYTDSDVAGITQPFKLLKYIPEGNTYIELSDPIFDYSAKTATFSVSSTTDPLFAIAGGSTTSTSEPPTTTTWLWATVVVIVVIIVLAAVMLLRSRRSK